MNGTLSVAVESVGLIGPGLADWAEACAILRGETPYSGGRCALPVPSALPAAERRRSGAAVRVALAAATAACQAAGRVPSALATVFASSGSDGDNCHAICEVLASDERFISPTRFHNSVHNAPAGYWSIAAQAMAQSTSLAAYDASFGAGLLEAVTQIAASGEPRLLVVYDAAYPEPLYAKRPIADAFAVALLLAPHGAAGIARLSLQFTDAPADPCSATALESLRLANPAARSLPLLALLARGRGGTATLDYLDSLRLRVVLQSP